MSAEQGTDDPTVIDSEQVDPGDRPLIDPPPDRERLYRTLRSSTTAQRRPIVPAWLRDRHDARPLGRFVIRHGLHVSTYHLTRSPKYAARLAGRTPVGLVRLVMVTLRFWWDAEAAPLRREAVDRNAFEEYFKLTKERNARVRTRGLILAALCGALIACCVHPRHGLAREKASSLTSRRPRDLGSTAAGCVLHESVRGTVRHLRASSTCRNDVARSSRCRRCTAR